MKQTRQVGVIALARSNIKIFTSTHRWIASASAQPTGSPSFCYWNMGNGTFQEVSSQTGTALRTPQVSRGLAVGDLFNTIALNIVVENLTGAPMLLQTRPNPKNAWVSFHLRGTSGDRLALNARVYVTTGAVTQMAEVRSGESYLSQSDLRLHFGLGQASVVDKVEVRWPDGKRQHAEHVPMNRFYIWEQGGEPKREEFSGC